MVHVDSIVRGTHAPQFAKYTHTLKLDYYCAFYMNKYIDLQMFELLR